jgi:tetratricopeptide (TPR) repeat protein
MTNHHHSRLALAGLLACLVTIGFSGCSVFSTIGGWISGGYGDTVAYFNAYYNAKRLFDEAEAEILGNALSARSQGQAVPQSGQIPPTARQKLNQVIDKCSNILSFYPKSGVVDDALVLIGKSYYYEGEYARAERKFSELLAQFPSGTLVLQGQLWYLKTLEKLDNFDDAMSAGTSLANDAKKADEPNIAAEADTILASLLTSHDRPKQAIEQYSNAVAVSDDGAMRAAAQSRIGDLYFSLQDYEKAAAAYLKVPEFSPDSYVLYYSQMQAALAYRIRKGYESTIALLQNMSRDYRLRDYLGTIRLELANTLAETGRTTEAADEYAYLDTTYVRTEVGARAALELGKLLEMELGDFESARVAFSHTAMNTTSPSVQEAQRRMGALNHYFQLHGQFAKADSVLHALDIDSLWLTKVSIGSMPLKDLPALHRDTLRTSAEKQTIAALRDSTRRSELADSAGTVQDTSIFVIRKPNKDSLIVVLASYAYGLGDVFYSELEIPDSAFFWYNQALKLHIDSTKAPGALIVLAQIAGADSAKKYGSEKPIYERLLKEFPKSSYTEQARIALGFPPTRVEADPAEQVYAKAESLIDAAQYQLALETLRRIVDRYPRSPLAAKSKYTMGWLYENRLSNPDSALSQYKQVVERYGSTAYAKAAQHRIPQAPPPGTAPSDSLEKRPTGPLNQRLQNLKLNKGDVDSLESRRGATADSTAAKQGSKKPIIE